MASKLMPHRDRLIIFARYPEVGKAKTRLIPALGPEGATALYRQLAEYTLAQVHAFQLRYPVDIEVRFAGGTQELMQRWLGQDLLHTEQGAGDLGERMARSLQAAFAAGATRSVIIGTDCPQLDAAILQTAFAQLEQHDLVLGPAQDGGYYLIGLRRVVPALFAEIAWSTAAVFAQTVELAEQLGLAIALLPTLSDIDYPEDLEVWHQIQQQTIGSTNVNL